MTQGINVYTAAHLQKFAIKMENLTEIQNRKTKK